MGVYNKTGFIMKLLTLLLILYPLFVVAQSYEQELLQDLEKIEIPANIESFAPLFHFKPINQDTTSVCWSFATLSFIETEAKRIGFKPVRLAMMFPPYYAFIEKARYFVQQKGNSRFEPGDLFNTVVDVIRKYGIVPLEVYPGKTNPAERYNHDALYAELRELMNNVKATERWDESSVVADVKKILDKYLGKPPEEFTYSGKSFTPHTFAGEYLALPWDDYILITSFMYAPYHQFISLEVPDNWHNYDRYYNVELDEFYRSLISAVSAGYSAAIDGDIGEPGRYGPLDISVIPMFDIPPGSIDQAAREYRFQKGITEDDHLMHIVGYQRLNGEDWFLVKDSWRDAWQGSLEGYFMYRGDFVKLKVLACMVHKDAVPSLIRP